MLIVDLLEKNAELYGSEVSLIEINHGNKERSHITWKEYELIENTVTVEYRVEITWKQFEDKANQVANLLLHEGIKKGDKVAILLMNCLEWLPIYFGVLKTGAVVVPMNYRYSAEEIKYCLELSQSKALLFGVEFVDRLESICASIPTVETLLYVGDKVPHFAKSYDQRVKKYATEKPKVSIHDEDDAAIYFSSGTTGFPKAILHDHKSVMSACITENKHHGQTREDNFLCMPPLYHTGAKMHWFGSLLAGSKAVLLRGVNPEAILKTVSQEKVTIVWLLVPWAQDILDGIDRGDLQLDAYQLEQWRLMHIGAQPVPPSLIHRWKKVFPHHQYDTNYGLSESIGPGCVHLGIDNIHKVGAIGKPGFDWQAKISNENGEDVPQGDVGELVVKGPGVMKCYYQDPEATAAVLKDGWLFTGDMARIDEEGFIYLVDRKKDVIISGGENIYPVQIEDFFRAHEAIKDIAVIGLPDQRLGEIAAAIIELKPGIIATESELMEFCEALPRYKRPRKIIFDDIPRNPTGKIEKPRLREKYGVSSLVASLTKS